MDFGVRKDWRRGRKKGGEHRLPCAVMPFMADGRERAMSDLMHPRIVSTTYLLVPRGLAHISEGRTKGFIPDARTIFGIRFHLGRHGQK
jgi:hypothetical protein